MIQPPWDKTFTSPINGKEVYIIHYTYGQVGCC
jgi:hypothetical protein